MIFNMDSETSSQAVTEKNTNIEEDLGNGLTQ